MNNVSSVFSTGGNVARNVKASFLLLVISISLTIQSSRSNAADLPVFVLILERYTKRKFKKVDHVNKARLIK